jgi:hypothetical protein
MPKDTPTGKELKNGTWVETTYEIRYIDRHGDAQEVIDFPTLKEAKKEFANKYEGATGEYVAWVLERHKAYFPFGRKPDSYVVLDYAGDDNALDAWGLE